jgi:hypothetical protein
MAETSVVEWDDQMVELTAAKRGGDLVVTWAVERDETWVDS